MNESQIFNGALRLATTAERAAYLAERCGDNAQLRSDVEGLLKLHDNDPGFLDKPVPALALTIEQSAPELPGTHIGRYKLL
jgi:eukaryotic-like serine/threonine-protein kinase